MTRQRTGGTLDSGEIPRGQVPPGLGGGVTTMMKTDARDRGQAVVRSAAGRWTTAAVTTWSMLLALMSAAGCSRATPVREPSAKPSHFRIDQPEGTLLTTGVLAVDLLTKGRLEVSVAPDPKAEPPFAVDYFVLRVRGPKNRKALEMPFVSSYGQFELSLFDFTNDYFPEIILVTGEGRGTSVRREDLRVFDCSSGKLELILERPVSDFTSSCSHWSYERSIWVDSGLEHRILRLLQVRDEPVLPPLEDYPADAVLDFAYDRRAKVMKQTSDLLDDTPIARPAAAAADASSRR